MPNFSFELNLVNAALISYLRKMVFAQECAMQRRVVGYFTPTVAMNSVNHCNTLFLLIFFKIFPSRKRLSPLNKKTLQSFRNPSCTASFVAGLYRQKQKGQQKNSEPPQIGFIKGWAMHPTYQGKNKKTIEIPTVANARPHEC